MDVDFEDIVDVVADENAKPNAKAKGGSKKKTIEQTYTKKTQLEHILLRPDTYVGSINRHTQPMWLYDSATSKMVNRECTYTPGLYKIFDEIIVNAADNKQRDPTMSKIEVSIDPEANMIKVLNDGSGIPIVLHSEHNVYIPELIFGHLLTGSNFDDAEQKTTGGRNGFGAKLANIFSTKFIVETADKSTGLKYSQTFEKNMGKKHEPVITKHKGKDYTCITFFPDLEKFKMDKLDEDIVGILSKRVYDIAGTNTAKGSKLNVYLNDKKLDVKSFQNYVSLYQGLEAPVAFERINDRWEIGFGISDGTFQQVSFVNSIATSKGGTHVNYIADQIAAKLVAPIKKKNKGAEVKAHQIKAHLAVYVNALIVNPAFDSQTKENMTTKASQFGSTCIIPDKLLKIVEKSGIIDNILSWAKFKQNAELKKKSGAKKSKLLGISKLDDANSAGTAKSKDCTLILTEGDSAKALAISGLGVIGRDLYGVFPLKGKLLNVREASHAQIMKNEEVQNIAKILGLSFGKQYEDTSSLRYGHLMLMTDQDHDGSHIKGLLINFIHHFWPSLLKIEGFLQQFVTPIVKCFKGKQEITFFTIPEYDSWKTANNDGKGWKIKYYKGLGTSTAQEAKEYFSDLSTHEIGFTWDSKSDDMIEMAFSKKRVDDRKLWLLGMEPGVHMDYNVDEVTYDEFVNKELILFSHADNERSIPHYIDGFKPSQRKVLFACFKRNLKQEIKVAQLAGYVSEHSAYHHGEASLTQTIVSMAQNFVGSNNINLLSPCGQFGTRLMGGKDAASPRYVFTKLENITRCIFHPHDDPLLDYQDDDGQSIEPTFYVPVIPMALVNGSDGIGTGWSSTVPTYNPREIIDNLRSMISGEEPKPMVPWFRGFKGSVVARSENQFTVSGIYEPIDQSTVMVTELPVGKWVSDYKQFLENSLVGNTSDDAKGVQQFVKEFKENHTDTDVKFTVSIPENKFAEIYHGPGGLQKKFKLDGSITTSNMHMFDNNMMIRKFESDQEIMKSFYDVRINFYGKRKEHLLKKLTEEWEKLDNKVRFILAVISGDLVISNRKKNDLLVELSKKGFKEFDESSSKKNATSVEDDDTNNDSQDSPPAKFEKGYDYLLSMKIWSLTNERVVALKAQSIEKKKELDLLDSKTPEELWIEDLDALEENLDIFESNLEETLVNPKVKSKSGRSKKTTAAAAYDSDEFDDDFMNCEDSDEEYGKKKKPKPKKAAPKAKAAAAPKAFVPPKTPEGFVKKAFVERKPAALKVAKAPVAKKSTAATKPKIITPKDDSSDDDEDPSEALSLFARLKLSGPASTSVAATEGAAVSSPPTKVTATKKAQKSKVTKDTLTPKPNKKTKKSASPLEVKAKKPAKKSVAKKVVDDSDDDFDEEFKPTTPAVSRRPAREKKTTNYAALMDEEEDDEEDEEEEEDSNSDDDGSSSSDFQSDSD